MKIRFTLLYIIFSLLTGIQANSQVAVYYGYRSANDGIMMYYPETGSTSLCISGIDGIGAIAIDNSVQPKRLYFTEKGEARIRSVNVDGTGLRDVVTGIDGLSKLALDQKNRLVYFTMDTDDDDRIYVADMDGLDSNIELLFYYSAENKDIRGITVDQDLQKLYWIRGGEDQSLILRSDLNGDNYEMFAKNAGGAVSLYAPTDVAAGGGYIFWSDPGMGYDRVNRLSADKKGFVNVANRVNVNQTIFDSNHNKLYMVVNAGMGSYALVRSNIDGSASERLMTLKQKPIGLAIASDINTPAVGEELKVAVRLGANRPNPFAVNTIIEYSISGGQDRLLNVNLSVFDMLGNRVLTVLDEKQAEGDYTVELSAENLSEGLYFYQLSVGDRKITRKMMVRR